MKNLDFKIFNAGRHNSDQHTFMVIWLCYTIHKVICFACLPQSGVVSQWSYFVRCLLLQRRCVTWLFQGVIVDQEVSIVFHHVHCAQCIPAKAGSLNEATSGVLCVATHEWEKQRENLLSVTDSLGIIHYLVHLHGHANVSVFAQCVNCKCSQCPFFSCDRVPSIIHDVDDNQ